MKGSDLKAFRKANNLTQEKLGEYLGIKKSFISTIESNKDPMPKDKLTKLLNNPHGWDTSMLTQTSKGDNTINVSGNNVDMRNINQSKGSDDSKRIKELEKRIEELIEDKKKLQDMVTKLLEKI